MGSDFFSATQDKRHFVLDPRTKLLLLIVISTIMLGSGNTAIMSIVKLILSVVPFLLLLSEQQIKMAVKYLGFYMVCFVLERMAVSWTSGIVSFILLAVSSIMTKFAPGIMTGTYFLSTTTVSEFTVSMERMHVSDKIVIPLSVIFRFFPTIKEEYYSISDAMRMRQISFGGKKFLAMIEYRLVPLMVSVVKIGDELSAAALARGLGAPQKSTNVCKIGFHVQDIVLIILGMLCLTLFILQKQI